MNEILDKLLENTKFTENTIKISFLPQKVGLGYKYVAPKNLELRKTFIVKKKQKREIKDESEEENMECMMKKRHRK